MRFVLAAILAVSLVPAHADYFPPDDPRTDGMRDIMLAYLRADGWRQEDFLPYVAYLDREQGGRPADWFYDSWLFLMFGGAPSGGAYYNGTATRADWDWYLDLLFAPQQNLAALNACLADVGRVLGQPPRVTPIIIMIPHLSARLESFGDLGDGVELNPSENADRIRAFEWVTDRIMERWEQADLPHLRLWGMYWMHEGVSGNDVEVVQATARHVRDRGLGFHWIPWFRAPGYDAWDGLGFDFAIMQPNFAFTAIPSGALVPNEDRLSVNAYEARRLGLGVEMELQSRVATDPADRLNLQLYLNHGVDELDGYMAGAVRAYYQSYDLVASLYRSDHLEANRLYDDMYRFHKGTYVRRAVSLCEGAAATLNGAPAPQLTDGVWMTRGERPERVVMATSPAVIEVDLAAAQMVGDVRVHVAAREDGRPAAPSHIRVYTSPDGERFERAAEVGCPSLSRAGEWRAGFALALFEPRIARRVRVEVVAAEGSEVGVGEVVMFPTSHALWAQPYHVEGAPAHGPLLTDGRLAASAEAAREDPARALRFSAPAASVAFELDRAWYLDRALAHVWRLERDAQPQMRVHMAGGGRVHETPWADLEAGHEGWIETPLPLMPVDSLTFELRGGAQVAWDQVHARRARNLTRSKPYVIEPPFEANYPDAGGVQLTDGLLSERGFGDRGTVGWFLQDVSVLLDLEESQDLDAVRVHVQGGGHAGVQYPTSIAIWASEDGGTWALLRDEEPHKEQVTYTATAADELIELAWLRADFPPTQARFVRLRFPSHAWLMLSEVEALAGEVNVAQGCPYRITPLPTTRARYGDNAARLTDGEYSRRGDGWKKAVGWDRDSPQITVDMLEPAEVAVMRAHCVGGGHGAVFFPLRLGFSTSLDGETWSEEVFASDPPAESGTETSMAFMGVEVAPRPARYVRVRVAERKGGWVMLDEIEAYPPARED